MANPGEQQPDQLMAQLYDRLRRMADQCFQASGNQTLQPTALVHEAYLKLASWEKASWRDEEHFFAIAATAMRQILTDRARQRRRHQSALPRERVTLSGVAVQPETDSVDLLALDDALVQLATLAPRQAQLMELRFFAGLTTEQAARSLGIGLSTAEKDWRMGRAWISRALAEPPAP